jgi:hypothetical protein
LFDLQTGIESDVVLEFDDLRPGDTFTLYEYSGEEVLCSGQKVMRVNSIKHKIDGSIILDVLPVVRPQFDPILN